MKAFSRPELWLGAALVGCFFLPWVSIAGLVILPGHGIPDAFKAVGVFASLTGGNGSFATLSYLLYLIPILGGFTVLFCRIDGSENQIRSTGFCTAIVPIVALLVALAWFGARAFDGIGFGGWLTLAASFGMILSVVDFIRTPNSPPVDPGVRGVVLTCTGLAFATGFFFLLPRSTESAQSPAQLTDQQITQNVQATSVTPAPDVTQPDTAAPVAPDPVQASIVTPPFKRDLEVLAQGSRMRGEDVRQLQRRLLELGGLDSRKADGFYGPRTAQTVAEVQQRNSLPATGVVDSETWAVIFGIDVIGEPYKRDLWLTPDGSRMTGEDVKRLQNRLMIVSGIDLGKGGDGFFGPTTEKLVTKFQENNGLTGTGVVDQTTWELLFSGQAKSASDRPAYFR